MIKIGTTFSGIGAPEFAAIRVFGDVTGVFACDIDKHAKDSFLANHTVETFYDNITTTDFTKHKGQLDIFVGGSPCQAFSLAGKRGGFNDTRGTLFFEFARAIKELEPKYFIFENVKGLVSHDKGKTFDTILRTFGELDYDITSKIMNTKEHGVPQNRERIFVVGVHRKEHTKKFLPKVKGTTLPSRIHNKLVELYDEGAINYWHEYKWADPEPLLLKLKDVLESDVDDKYYISDKRTNTIAKSGRGIGFGKKTDELSPTHHKIPTDGYYLEEPQVLKKKRTDEGKRVRKDYESGKLKCKYSENIKYEPGTDGCCGTLTSVQKDNYVLEYIGTLSERDWIGDGKSLSRNSPSGDRVYSEDGISTTIAAEGGGKGGSSGLYEVTDKRIRKLTPRECLRLQDFPEDFKFVVSNTQLYKQAGNSMTVRVIEKIMQGIKDRMEEPIPTAVVDTELNEW